MLLRCESLEPLMSQLGSKSAVSRFLRHGCFTPALGHSLARLAGPKSARKRHMHRSKQHRYSITSSACTSTCSGSENPMVSAVFRLTTKKNRVGCSTGRSAGFAPLKILST